MKNFKILIEKLKKRIIKVFYFWKTGLQIFLDIKFLQILLDFSNIYYFKIRL